jgi:hypothetical protein
MNTGTEAVDTLGSDTNKIAMIPLGKSKHTAFKKISTADISPLTNSQK